MNNNNLYNTNNFIGTLHQDYFKTASNALANQIVITSNILEYHSSNYTNNVSNLVKINSSNYTDITSNFIVNRYDKLIKEEIEQITLPLPATLKHTYIYNSNLAGEIRFWCKSTPSFPVINPIGVPDYRVKIDVDGKLKVYYTYDPAINLTFGNGWVDVGNSIVALNASDANIGITITGLEAQILLFNNKFNELGKELAQEFQMRFDLEEEEYNTLLNNLRNVGYYTTSGYIGEFSTFTTGILQTIRTGSLNYLQTALNNIALIIAQNPVVSFFLGLGGIGFAAAATAIQDLAYLEVLVSEVRNQISINSNLTPTQKNELYSSNNNLRILKTISYCSNVSNLTLYQGFINSNIQTQQYVPNLKCDVLNLNTGNINNINYITANEINSSGKIKQNNILLDNTYLTSNSIYNLAYTYTAERQYPSKAYTTSSIEDTITLLGKTVYRQILYLDTTSITYGNGFYEVYSSSSYDTPTTKDKLFNFNTTETTTSARFAINQYNSGTGNYQSANYIKNDYYGDWVILKLSQQIMLTRYRIYQRSDFLTKAPAEWKVYGSNDGITFTEITEASQTSRLSSYTSGFYEKTLASTFTTQYQYIGFTFNKLLSTSGQTDLSFAELQIFGKEIISNSIVSNVYTTSNACKNVIIYDTPEVCKHFAFYILITTPININGNTYYKYDIDLRQYTKLGYIQIGGGSNDPYRIFKIRAFYATSYFGTLIGGLPDVVYADIFMSFKAAGSGLGQAGLNVCSIGNISNPSLTSVPPNNLFFMRNGANSIDYITVVSKSTADVRVIIEDLLG